MPEIMKNKLASEDLVGIPTGGYEFVSLKVLELFIMFSIMISGRVHYKIHRNFTIVFCFVALSCKIGPDLM